MSLCGVFLICLCLFHSLPSILFSPPTPPAMYLHMRDNAPVMEPLALSKSQGLVGGEALVDAADGEGRMDIDGGIGTAPRSEDDETCASILASLAEGPTVPRGRREGVENCVSLLAEFHVQSPTIPSSGTTGWGSFSSEGGDAAQYSGTSSAG